MSDDSGPTRHLCILTLACLLAFVAGAFVGSCTDSVAMFWRAAYFNVREVG